MSGSPAKTVPEINLDEFEKRLRSAGARPSGAEDPLAELTRLVNMISRDAAEGGGRRGSASADAQSGRLSPAANDGVDGPVAHVELGRDQAPSASRGAVGRDPRRPPRRMRRRRDGGLAPPRTSIFRRRAAARRRRRRWRRIGANAPLAFLVFRDCGSGGDRVALLGGAATLKHAACPSAAKRRRSSRRRRGRASIRRRATRPRDGRRYRRVADEGFGDLRAGQESSPRKSNRSTCGRRAEPRGDAGSCRVHPVACRFRPAADRVRPG